MNPDESKYMIYCTEHKKSTWPERRDKLIYIYHDILSSLMSILKVTSTNQAEYNVLSSLWLPVIWTLYHDTKLLISTEVKFKKILNLISWKLICKLCFTPSDALNTLQCSLVKNALRGINKLGNVHTV
jgi:hypothetical protein